MKKTSDQLNYGVRRVAYLTAVFAEAYADLATPEVRLPRASRAAALLMARNLDDFFHGPKTRFSHDLRVSHFNCNGWTPDLGRKIDPRDRKRLDRIIAHVVDHDPLHFETRKKLKAFVRPTFETACEFLRHCRERENLSFDSKALGYVNEINQQIPGIHRDYRSWKIPFV